MGVNVRTVFFSPATNATAAVRVKNIIISVFTYYTYIIIIIYVVITTALVFNFNIGLGYVKPTRFGECRKSAPSNDYLLAYSLSGSGEATYFAGVFCLKN